MKPEGTLLLNRSDVRQLLTVPECIDAVENVFRSHGEGKIPSPGILGVKAAGGGLHVKAGLLPGVKDFLVAKLNTNFPNNRAQSGLPTIQGVIVVCDARNGYPLAILDSIDITIKRTAAASAVAAKYLARNNSAVATICGCGAQGRAHASAIHSVVRLKKIFAFDLDDAAAKRFATQVADELKIDVEAVGNSSEAIQNSDVVVTCTTATHFFVGKSDVRPGSFVAAVGADDVHKQEIDPALMASAKIVADSLEQCCTIGDTHHAIAKDLMSKEDVYAELGDIVASQKRGRTHDSEIIVFDSTGVAIEDAAAAVKVYEKALAARIGINFQFAVGAIRPSLFEIVSKMR